MKFQAERSKLKCSRLTADHLRMKPLNLTFYITSKLEYETAYINQFSTTFN